MTKKEFVQTVVAHHMSIFTNSQALIANVRDTMRLAEQMYDVLESEWAAKEIKEKRPLKTASASRSL